MEERTNVNVETAKSTNQAAKLVLTKPAHFDACADVMLSTTNELGRVINDIFSNVFADYYGCSITVQMVTSRGFYIIPKLYFHVLSDQEYDREDKVFAFKPIGKESSSNSLLDKVKNISNVATVMNSPSRGMLFTEDGKSILEDFMLTTNGKIDFNKCFESKRYTNETIISVFKLDILKIVSKIYGEIDSENTPYYYQITPTFQIGSTPYKNSENWGLYILRLRHGAEARAAEQYGIAGPSADGISNIIRA